MQDLIFNGTDTRKSMSYCEVSLFFDNTTRIFPIAMDEIIISRKLYRSKRERVSSQSQRSASARYSGAAARRWTR